MDVQIFGRNLRVSEKLEEYAQRKLSRLDRYLPNISDVRLEMTRQHTRQGKDVVVVQLTVRHKRGAILRAEERATESELATALTSVIDNMYRRIERFKGKQSRKGLERFGAVYAATEEEVEAAEDIPAEELAAGDATDEVPYTPEVARRKQIRMVPMSERDAMEQMELLGHNFFIFHNQSTDKVEVLYRRADGDYGILAPVTGE
jgi:putative sigma-54 modulation protein